MSRQALPEVKPTLRLLGPDDAAVLDRVAEGVFDHPVEPALAAELLADPRHHVAAAVADGVVVGMATGVHYVHPDKPPELWVNEVGVAPAHRGAGLAGRLLKLLLDRGRELGCREAWVLTQAGNEAARRVYRRAGGREDPAVVMYDFDLTKP